MSAVEFTYGNSSNDTVSDMHMDAYGFRPSQNWWADWQSSNPVGKQQTWDELEHTINTRKYAK